MSASPFGRVGARQPLALLVVGTVAVVVLGVAADLVHHHIRPYDGIRSALRLNGESNLAAWWNAMLLLTGGGLAGLASLQARHLARARAEVAGWLAVAVALTALSLDEAVQLHERLVLFAPYLPRTSTYQWVVPGVILGTVGLAGVALAARALPLRVRRGLGSAAVLYAVGAVGVEGLNGWIQGRYGAGDLYRLSTALEESLEMVACLLAIGTITAGLRRNGPLLLPPVRTTVVGAGSVWAAVVVVSVAVALLAQPDPESPYAYHVYLWREGGAAAWVQAGLWWSAAVLFLHAARAVSPAHRPLVVLAAVTGLVSASEMGRLHELVGRMAVAPGAPWGEARWVPIGVAVAVVAVGLILWVPRDLPRWLTRRLVLAVVLLAVGAVAGDLADGRLETSDDVRPRLAAAAASETLEVVAALLVLAAALALARSDPRRSTASWASDDAVARPARMGSAGPRGPDDLHHSFSPPHRRSPP